MNNFLEIAEKIFGKEKVLEYKNRVDKMSKEEIEVVLKEFQAIPQQERQRMLEELKVHIKYLILLGFMNNNNGLFGNKGDATVTSAIANEGNWQNVISKLDQLGAGLSSGLSNLGYQNSQGFNGVESSICSSTFNTSKEISNLASTMAQTCNLEKYVNEAIANSTNSIIAHLLKK